MPTRRRQRSFWRFSAPELRGHALLLALVLWLVAAGMLLLGSPYRDPFGQLKWNDFVHFYTLGHIARYGPVSELYDAPAQHERQVSLVPASASERYLPAYPPQMALVFAPLAEWPYRLAGPIWAMLTACIYGFSLWLAWRPLRDVLSDTWLLALAAAAFPPFWSLVLNGQSTAIVILGFTIGAFALVRGHTLMAGLGFGLLLFKPQLGLMLAVIVLVGREWSILLGLLLSATLQAAVVGGVLGLEVISMYVQTAAQLFQVREALEPRPEQMHSIATLTGLLPSPVSGVSWLAAGAWVSWLTLRVWRSALPVRVRLAVLVVGSVLLSPHVNGYDLAVLAVPLLWLTAWTERVPAELEEFRVRFRLVVYGLFVFSLLPTARFISVQISVILLLWIIYDVARIARSGTVFSAQQVEMEVRT